MTTPGRTTGDAQHHDNEHSGQGGGFWAQPEEVSVSSAALPYAPAFYTIANLPGFQPVAGVDMQIMAGQNVMVNWVRIEPGAAVPDHAHPHEQLGFVLEGEINMTIDGETRVLRPGDAYAIPGTVSHGASAGPNGCVVIDIFSPLRDDYVAAAKPRG
jgi:quercetin dioxygenase-like cupin family protein